MSGEMILSIAVGLALVVSGVLAYRGAIRSFTNHRPDPRGKPPKDG
jgi:hypothetical protein